MIKTNVTNMPLLRQMNTVCLWLWQGAKSNWLCGFQHYQGQAGRINKWKIVTSSLGKKESAACEGLFENVSVWEKAIVQGRPTGAVLK